MKYFAVSDTHGYYTPLREELSRKGFDINNPDHKLVVCGDLMDRGYETLALTAYISSLIDLDKVILIRGNHEDLLVDMVEKHQNPLIYRAHFSNGTYKTACDLASSSPLALISHYDGGVITKEATEEFERVCKMVKNSSFYTKIIPAMLDYYETSRYIFVHGWMPDVTEWRHATKEEWQAARWMNGMEECLEKGRRLKNKTVVCGHFDTAWGHMKYNEHFFLHSPFISPGIIALDGCVPVTNEVNCVVLED